MGVLNNIFSPSTKTENKNNISIHNNFVSFSEHNDKKDKPIKIETKNYIIEHQLKISEKDSTTNKKESEQSKRSRPARAGGWKHKAQRKEKHIWTRQIPRAGSLWIRTWGERTNSSDSTRAS